MCWNHFNKKMVTKKLEYNKQKQQNAYLPLNFFIAKKRFYDEKIKKEKQKI